MKNEKRKENEFLHKTCWTSVAPYSGCREDIHKLRSSQEQRARGVKDIIKIKKVILCKIEIKKNILYKLLLNRLTISSQHNLSRHRNLWKRHPLKTHPFQRRNRCEHFLVWIIYVKIYISAHYCFFNLNDMDKLYP